jgi:chromosome segregation ATPase
MIKKLVLFGALAVVGLTVVFGTAGLSYVRTGWHAASDSVRQNVPVEWEIKRARQMIEDLKPEITSNMQMVAREEVGVERLAAEVANKNQQIAKAKNDILRLKGDLESGSVRFVYAGRDYSSGQVKDDLAARFKQFQVHEKTASKLSQILSAREKNLVAARCKLDEMLSAKRQLEVEIENLQARLTMVQVAQTASPVALDDSQLSCTRQLLDDIRTRIDVAEKLASSEGALEGTIPLEETAPENLLTEIADYFGEGRAEIESLVSRIDSK